MNKFKILGFAFLAIAVFVIVLGVNLFNDSVSQASDRIYTKATITEIKVEGQQGTANKKNYMTYVEYEANGETICARLDYYDSTYEVGKEVDIFYLEENPYFVHTPTIDIVYLIVVLFGLIFGTLGIAIMTGKIK